MKSENGCPFCQTHVIEVVASTPPAVEGYQAQCDNCGARGPIYPSKDEAVAGWELGINGAEGRMRRS
jgi:hypothetical protein